MGCNYTCVKLTNTNDFVSNTASRYQISLTIGETLTPCCLLTDNIYIYIHDEIIHIKGIKKISASTV